MNLIFLKNKQQYNSAFTLVEIIVVLGLFSSIMTIAAGALFTTQAINTKLQETQSILDNVNLSLETMTREIRYGTDFHCSTVLLPASILQRRSCPFANDSINEGGTILFFKPNAMENSKDRVAYYLTNNGVLYKDEYICEDVSCNTVATTSYQITGDDVTIKSLTFYVSGANTHDSLTDDFRGVHDDLQPLITLVVVGETKTSKKRFASDGTEKDSNKVVFMVQTSISARELDNR